MYVRRYDPSDEGGTDTGIRLPENYAGVAFSAAEPPTAEDEGSPHKDEVHEDGEDSEACIARREKDTLSLFPFHLPFVGKAALSPDLLLLLLAALLMGEKDGIELSSILLFLLLFE